MGGASNATVSGIAPITANDSTVLSNGSSSSGGGSISSMAGGSISSLVGGKVSSEQGSATFGGLVITGVYTCIASTLLMSSDHHSICTVVKL